MNTRGGNMDIDDSGLHDINEEDMENREKPKVTYICGGMYLAYFNHPFIHVIFLIQLNLGCGKDNKLDKDSVIRCNHCGHRIFYKKRERKLLQYEAR